MYRNDYRTEWQRESDTAAVRALNALNALDGGDAEKDHGLADDILLGAVHPDVADAYRRFQDRAHSWATA